MEELVYLNGRLMPLHEARISVLDYGFLYGYGLFETMRAYTGVVFRLDNHLSRLASSADLLKIPVDAIELRNAVEETIQANRLREARVRLAVSMGEGTLIPDPSSCGHPTVLVAAVPFVPYRPETYRKGFRTVTSSIRRFSHSYLTGMKTANYLENLISRQEARSQGADDAILLNEKNQVAEASTSNIFFRSNKLLKTPRLENGLLPGITRGAVLELAAKSDIEVFEDDVQLEELLAADEVFITNSIVEIMPVARINDKAFDLAERGWMTRKLTNDYREMVLRETAGQVNL